MSITRAKFEALAFQVKTLAAHLRTQLIYATHRRAKKKKKREGNSLYFEGFFYKPGQSLH
jgi:hypothetical protein